jgi:hypothetical protein
VEQLRSPLTKDISVFVLDKKGNYIDKTANNKDRDGDVERDTDEA